MHFWPGSKSTTTVWICCGRARTDGHLPAPDQQAVEPVAGLKELIKPGPAISVLAMALSCGRAQSACRPGRVASCRRVWPASARCWWQIAVALVLGAVDAPRRRQAAPSAIRVSRAVSIREKAFFHGVRRGRLLAGDCTGKGRLTQHAPRKSLTLLSRRVAWNFVTVVRQRGECDRVKVGRQKAPAAFPPIPMPAFDGVDIHMPTALA